MKSQHWYYILFLIIFTITLDLAFGWLYDRLYFSPKSMQNDRLIHSVFGTTEDILIFGSSRAAHHYNPKIIEDKFGMGCYNVGHDGQNIYYHLALLEATLERYTPKIVILDLTSSDFEFTSSHWDKEGLSILFPFYHRSEAARKAVLRRGWTEKIKANISAIYPFNSSQLTIVRNNYIPYKHINGFVPLDKVWNGGLKKKEVLPSEIDNEKKEALYQFIKLCNESKVKLFIFVSPYFIDLNGKSKFKNLATELKNKAGIELVSFENEPFFMDHPELFADPSHLNREGANKYSEIIAAKIISGCNENK